MYFIDELSIGVSRVNMEKAEVGCHATARSIIDKEVGFLGIDEQGIHVDFDFVIGEDFLEVFANEIVKTGRGRLTGGGYHLVHA